MTEEEIQQGYHDNCVIDTDAPPHLQCPSYYTHDGWMQGAGWMQKKMIDKACLEFCNCFGCGSFEICNKEKTWCVARLNFNKAMMDSYGRSI